MESISVNQLSTNVLLQMNKELGQEMEGDVVLIDCPIYPPLDDEFRVVAEGLNQKENIRHLVVVLKTHGGIMETVERLVEVMRAHYKQVSFVIPNFAYSAGTVLALSGDNIWG